MNMERLSSNQWSFHYHKAKVLVLETISDLIGCTRTFPLGDGTIPDVVRINDSQTLLFIGDAKETEGPKNKHTRVRLYKYLLWLRAYIARPLNHGVFAICFRDISDQRGWIITVQELVKQAQIRFSGFKFTRIDEGINLLWFYFSS